jgi:hypothetical protein
MPPAHFRLLRLGNMGTSTACGSAPQGTLFSGTLDSSDIKQDG